jgi:maspardin
MTRIHLVGCSLGGYIAAHFTSYFPSRVASLVLCNSFVSTQAFVETMPLLATGGVAFNVMPAFALRAVIMQSLDQGTLLPEVADAVDFVVEELDSVPREQLASRLAAHCAIQKVRGPLRMEVDQILIIESHDKIARPPRLKEELLQFFAGSKVGEMKHGGDFPYLSFPDEFNIFVEVHLKRNGYRLS